MPDSLAARTCSRNWPIRSAATTSGGKSFMMARPNFSATTSPITAIDDTESWRGSRALSRADQPTELRNPLLALANQTGRNLARRPERAEPADHLADEERLQRE